MTHPGFHYIKLLNNDLNETAVNVDDYALVAVDDNDVAVAAVAAAAAATAAAAADDDDIDDIDDRGK